MGTPCTCSHRTTGPHRCNCATPATLCLWLGLMDRNLVRSGPSTNARRQRRQSIASYHSLVVQAKYRLSRRRGRGYIPAAALVSSFLLLKRRKFVKGCRSPTHTEPRLVQRSKSPFKATNQRRSPAVSQKTTMRRRKGRSSAKKSSGYTRKLSTKGVASRQSSAEPFLNWLPPSRG